jgi:hypothetical protein
MQHLPDVTNILQSNSFKRQLSWTKIKNN